MCKDGVACLLHSSATVELPYLYLYSSCARAARRLFFCSYFATRRYVALFTNGWSCTRVLMCNRHETMLGSSPASLDEAVSHLELRFGRGMYLGNACNFPSQKTFENLTEG